jgi:hypothetical protein
VLNLCICPACAHSAITLPSLLVHLLCQCPPSLLLVHTVLSHFLTCWCISFAGVHHLSCLCTQCYHTSWLVGASPLPVSTISPACVHSAVTLPGLLVHLLCQCPPSLLLVHTVLSHFLACWCISFAGVHHLSCLCTQCYHTSWLTDTSPLLSLHPCYIMSLYFMETEYSACAKCHINLFLYGL